MRNIEEMYIDHEFPVKQGKRPIFVSSDDEGNRYLCTRLSGQNAYLVVPVDTKTLLQLIDDWLSIHEVYRLRTSEVRVITQDGSIEMPRSGMWPRKGEYLNDNGEKKGSYRRALTSEWHWSAVKRYEIEKANVFQERNKASQPKKRKSAKPKKLPVRKELTDKQVEEIHRRLAEKVQRLIALSQSAETTPADAAETEKAEA